jgi:hypothetical protein
MLLLSESGLKLNQIENFRCIVSPWHWRGSQSCPVPMLVDKRVVVLAGNETSYTSMQGHAVCRSRVLGGAVPGWHGVRQVGGAAPG